MNGWEALYMQTRNELDQVRHERDIIHDACSKQMKRAAKAEAERDALLEACEAAFSAPEYWETRVILQKAIMKTQGVK